MITLMKGKTKPAAICESMLRVVEYLDNDTRLKLAPDLAVFFCLCLSTDRKQFEARVSGICASVGASNNDLVKLVLCKENTDLLI
jgi:hypothetical protein